MPYQSLGLANVTIIQRDQYGSICHNLDNIGIVTRLRSERSSVRTPVAARDYSPKGPGRLWAHWASYYLGFTKGKVAVREVNHPPPSSA